MAIKINYKMSKQNKISLSQILDPHERGIQRRLIVAADLHMMSAPKRNPLDKEKGPGRRNNPEADTNTETKAE
jgi:hypothetical protein